jgi:hypothetical protein
MPARAWPDWMGVPVADGYGVDVADRRESSEIAMGSEARPLFGVDEGRISCSLFCNPLQANWLEGAERDLFRQGSRWVAMRLWIAGKLARHEVRFTARPKLAQKTGRWSTYSLTLELARRDGLGPPEGGWALEIGEIDGRELPRWPLRPPLVDGYTVEPADRRVTTEMEDGTIRRVEFGTDEATAQCSLWLNAEEAAWFEAFERDYLKQGSEWMIMPLWVGGRLTDHAARFRERPRLTGKEGGWATYTFPLAVAGRRGLMDEDLQEGLLAVSPWDLMEISDLLDWTMNQAWPAVLPHTA